MSDQLPLLESLSSQELNDLAKQAEKLLQARKKSKLKEIFNLISEMAEKNELSLDEIIDLINKNKNKRVIRKKVPVKYQNPSNSNETWTGRGRKPKWLSHALNTGSSIENFLL